MTASNRSKASVNRPSAQEPLNGLRRLSRVEEAYVRLLSAVLDEPDLLAPAEQPV